ncbi:DNRLRE domain-containing protein [Candidatus Pacearchaeota archaeon]|nr:DNRLRE domain-containing protein [Candidatus Pacearchaeota archaeon]
MNKKRIRKEHIVTYLFVFVFIGLAIGGLYFLNVSMTGFAVYTFGPGEGQTTLMLQDADSDNLGDAYVGSGGDASHNFGTSNLLKTGSVARTYINFNISGIPFNQNIDNATLCLYVLNTKKTQIVNVSHVYSDWDESALTWNNQPCGTGFDNSSACNLTAESFVQLDSTSNLWRCWDVTNTVGEDYDSGDDNVSMVLYTLDADINSFNSKEALDSSLRPYLNVTYHLANSAPIINLIEPQDQLYLSNESLALDFTVFDHDDNLNSCWYNLDDGANITLASCANTTFSIAEGSHVLKIYTNDSLGLESSDSAGFDVDSTGVFVSVTEPTGEKTSRTGIPITYSVVGDDLTCWYNVKTSIGGAVIDNTTLENCSGSTFDVSTDGDYIFNLYLNNSFGNSGLDNSNFSVDTSSDSSSSSSSSSSSGGGGGSGGGTVVLSGRNKLEINPLSNLVANPGDTKKLTLHVKNIGTNFLNDCKIKASEKSSFWISSDELKNLAAGEEYGFDFDLNVLDDAESGEYILDLFLECKELEMSVDFVVEVIEQRLLFELVNVERISDEEVRVVYFLEELSGLEQEVELQFLLLGSSDEKAAEIKETRFISANSQAEFSILIPVDSSLEGDLNLLVNLNSKTYSTFVQENIILGSPISGFTVFGERWDMNTVLSVIFVILFLVFAFFIIRRILKLRKKSKK